MNDETVCFTSVTTPERFFLTIGCYRETYPEAPEDLPVGIYDYKHKRLVLAINPAYANLICLETLPDGAPFTALVDWLNNTSAEAFESEGVPS